MTNAERAASPRTDAEANAEGQGRMSSMVSADFARTLERELADLRAENARLRKDAERYRHLRISGGYAFVKMGFEFDHLLQESELDAAIDAALSARD
jgi:hypothetical protein